MKNELLEKEYRNNKNIIITGDLSAGKTTKIMFPLLEKMINQNESMLVLDSKEEYINRYYNDLKEKDYNIVILNLRDLDKSDGWNLLEYPYNLYKKGYKDKALEYVQKLCKTIFCENGSVDPFWSLTSSDFFTGVVLGLFEDAKEEEINLNSVNSMFNGVDIKVGMIDCITSYFKMKEPNSQAYICASGTILAPSETKGGILTTAKQKLMSYVTKEKLNILLNKTTFNYDDILNKPTAIFVIARDENRYLNSIVSMFVEQLFSILIDLKVSKKFNFVLDNFDDVEYFNGIIDMLGSGISRNIKFIIGTRSLDKILDDYGLYIKKLCNLIIISDDGIKINNEKVNNDYEELEIKKSDVSYPILNSKEIKIFDLEKFVRAKKKGEIERNISNQEHDQKLFQNSSFDKLFKKIDEEIAKLDTEDK